MQEYRRFLQTNIKLSLVVMNAAAGTCSDCLKLLYADNKGSFYRRCPSKPQTRIWRSYKAASSFEMSALLICFD